jgi:hypothetical protein
MCGRTRKHTLSVTQRRALEFPLGPKPYWGGESFCKASGIRYSTYCSLRLAGLFKIYCPRGPGWTCIKTNSRGRRALADGHFEVAM